MARLLRYVFDHAKPCIRQSREPRGQSVLPLVESSPGARGISGLAGLKHLLGGEDFWGDIEAAIRNRAVKVLYVLSRTSNTKPGALKELALAQTVAKVNNFHDFVIPLKLDDIPHADINIDIHRLNAISFEASWAQGFQQLLLKLEQDGVQKDARFTPDAVTTWWRTQFNANAGVVNEPTECLSNWFEIAHMPVKLFCHEGKLTLNSNTDADASTAYPTVEVGGRWLSFADAAHLAPAFNIRRTRDFATQDVLEGLLDERHIPKSESKKIVSYLLVDNWVRMLRLRDMAVYQLSNHRFCGALRQNQVPDDKITYTGIDGKSAWRGIIGYKTMTRGNAASWVRFWHFAVQAKAQFFPVWAYLITNHVVFSEDGQHLWDGRERQHNARRSQCKNWWNDDWRDRMLAMMNWLAEGSDRITIDCGGDVIEVSPRPLTFASPIRFSEDEIALSFNAAERELVSVEMDDAQDEEFDGEEGGGRMTRELTRIPEPTLMFRHGQAVEDPRDGLALFGPLDEAKPYGIRAGIIGTSDGNDAYKKWVQRIMRPVSCDPPVPSRPPFPGFEAAFQIPWTATPVLELVVDDKDIDAAIYQSDRHQRVYKAVDLYAERMIRANRDEDAKADLWFVVIPDRVRQYCRPRSSVQASVRIQSEQIVSPDAAARVEDAPFMFAEMNEASQPYQFEPHFHNQLKSRLLPDQVLTQIIQHKTISDPANWSEREKKSLAKMQSQIAWNLSTATFYKSGGRPWKLNGIRPGVCYVGIVFKQDQRSKDVRNACCAAQMFLDSGDGVVFKGAVGPWYNPVKGNYHLSRRAAKELVGIALQSYCDQFSGPPKEMFIHGKVRFGDEEWQGFLDAVGKSTAVVGVTIGEGERLKLFSTSTIPVLRGMAWISSERRAYLWTRGFVPRLRTYPGLEVPNPLHIGISHGDADINIVLADILALTKLNYNACIYADGLPVTLKFANAVGEILTAGPMRGTPPLPFKHYI